MHNELIQVKHNNQLILTTEQLATAYDTDTNNIKNNFNNNQNRFVYGEDYYKLEGQLLKDFKSLVKDFDLVDKFSPSLMLWTERGVLKHMKMLGTDEAWAGYDILIDTYFKAKELKPIEAPKTLKEALILALEQQEKIEQLEQQTNILTTNLQAATANIKQPNEEDAYALAKLFNIRSNKNKLHVQFINQYLKHKNCTHRKFSKAGNGTQNGFTTEYYYFNKHEAIKLLNELTQNRAFSNLEKL